MISPQPGRSICITGAPLTPADLPGVDAYDQVFTDGAQTDIKSLRQVISQFQQSPTGSIRALVINNADKLSELTQNTLLKVIEEPPSQGAIILHVQSVDSLLPTVRSRVLHSYTRADRSAGESFDLSKLATLNRQEAINYLEQSINTINLSDTGGLTKHELLSQASRRLKQNLNAKLVIDWLLLNWSQEFGKE